MNNWYTVENIDDDTLVISEPGHPEDPHCYLLKGEKQAILIDTGLGVYSMGELILSLTDLPILVLTTHAHWDHVGSHWDFSRIAIHPEDLLWISGYFPMNREQLLERLHEDGWQAPEDFDESIYEPYDGGADFIFQDGDLIDLGGRKLRVIHTPGHSPGHCCFYEADRGYLYCGDMAYDGCLYCHFESCDPLAYRMSMHRIDQLEIKRLLPGHNSLNSPRDMITRMAEAFDELYDKGLLKLGAGLFEYGDFRIKL